MGNANTHSKEAVLINIGESLGPHPMEHVVAAAAITETLPLVDMQEKGIGIHHNYATSIDLSSHLNNIIDALRELELHGMVIVSVTTPSKEEKFYLIGKKDNGDNSWVWELLLKVDAQVMQNSYLSLAGLLPNKKLASHIPWGIVPNFMHQVHKCSDELNHVPIPTIIVPLILAAALKSGNVVVVECDTNMINTQ